MNLLEPYKEAKKNPWGKLLLILVVLGVVFAALKTCTIEKPPFDADLSAYTTATMAVKERLKAPSTAVFQSSMYAKITSVGDKYRVSAYVDSQNSFSAVLRTNFTVMLRKEGEHFEVLEVVFDNE